ncbi:hypothetical protein [Candidatus Uabimicrobium sp. HlEnr_7]|uniref:hypothetical protein n=1 Tax=Candidatus Uabimicrobium helgolandensis TaxID=3095367 RepID=UPI0035572C77
MSKLFISGVFLSLLFIGCTSNDVRDQESQVQNTQTNSDSSPQEQSQQTMQEEQVVMLKVIGMT